MYINRLKFRVRYPETDKMGIVYHANYIIWFDMGRTEFLRSLGYSYRDLEDEGIWFPIIDLGCSYHIPAKYDDEVTVETYIKELSRVRLKFGYRVMRGEELLVEGFTVQAFTTDKLKPIGLSKYKPDLYKKLEEACKF